MHLLACCWHLSILWKKGGGIGTVGFANLWSPITEALIKNGMEFGSCVNNTKNLIKNANMIILATRPQNIIEIAKHRNTWLWKDYLILSFIAALHLSVLSSYFDCRVSRTMCIGPETISGKRGICVIYQKNDTAQNWSIFVIWKKCKSRQKLKQTHSPQGYTSPILMNIHTKRKERTRGLDGAVKAWVFLKFDIW